MKAGPFVMNIKLDVSKCSFLLRAWTWHLRMYSKFLSIWIKLTGGVPIVVTVYVEETKRND
jgi:hypothetical protein